MSTVYLNGEFMPLAEAKIPVMDRGFIFGDGVYEYIPCYGGKPRRMQHHLDRLYRSLAGTRIANPMSREAWVALIGRMIETNGGDNVAVYIQITRGVMVKRDHPFPKDTPPTVFVMATPLMPPAAEIVEHGVACLTREDFRWHRCDLKVTSLLGNVLLRQEAADQGCYETILIRDGLLQEGTSSNVMIVKDGTLLAPPKTELMLAGITYDLVLELESTGGVPYLQREIGEAELRSADEIVLMSSGREVVAVTTLDGRPVSEGTPGPVFRELHRRYQAYKETLQ